MNIPKLIELARNASKKSDHPYHKLGAVVFDKQGRVMSVGYNFHTKTHPLIRKYDQFKTLHAETCAILGIRHFESLKKSSILIYREHKNGQLAMAKPCEVCLKIIKSFGIDKVMYTTNNGLVTSKAKDL